MYDIDKRPWSSQYRRQIYPDEQMQEFTHDYNIYPEADLYSEFPPDRREHNRERKVTSVGSAGLRAEGPGESGGRRNRGDY